MGNIIMMKDADFSANKVGKLNIEKLNVTFDDMGAVKLSGGSFVPVPDVADWTPSTECAHSPIIDLPKKAIRVFGRISIVASTSSLNSFIADNTQEIAGQFPMICYYNENANAWSSTGATHHIATTPIRVLGNKDGLYAGGNYSAVLIDGGFYGEAFNPAYSIKKLRFNWLVNISEQAPELGMYVPEIYVEYAE